MRFIIYILALSFLFTSCRARRIESNTNEIFKDSISVKVTSVIKDTTIVVPRDSVVLSVPISDLSNIPVVKKSDRTMLKVSKVDDIILAECNSDELIEIITWQEKLIEIYEKNIYTLESKEEIPVKYIPLIVTILAWIGAGSILFLIVKITIKIYKPK